MKLRKIFTALLALGMLVGCSHEVKVNESTEAIRRYLGDRYTNSEGAPIIPLDTAVGIVTYYDDFSEQAFEILSKEVEKYHKLVDTNNYYLDENGNKITNLAVVNDSYGTEEAVVVDEAIIEILENAKKLMKLSNGYFNMTLGSVINLYDGKFMSYDSYNTDPSGEDMQSALACSVGVDKIDDFLEIDAEAKSVTLHKVEGCNGKVQLQLGAINKGYIGRKLSEALDDLKISYILDLGTSTQLFNYGEYDTKNSWTIAINDPYGVESYELAIKLNDDSAMSTSGDYQQYYFVDNGDGTVTKRMHILDSTTGFSNNYYREVAVTANGNYSDVLDSLSTALFNIEDSEERKAMIKAYNEAYGIEISYLLVKEIDAANKEVEVICNQAMKDAIVEGYTASNVKKITVE